MINKAQSALDQSAKQSLKTVTSSGPFKDVMINDKLSTEQAVIAHSLTAREREREMGRQRQTDRQADREREGDRQTDRQKEKGQTDRQTEGQTDRERTDRRRQTDRGTEGQTDRIKQ